MPIVHTENQYLIPRGRAYFDPFNASEQLTGEIDLGNCPAIALNISTEKSEHFSSQSGLREKDGAWITQITRAGSLSCDNFTPSNAALWMAGTSEKKTQAAATIADEARKVLPGRQYQLGVTALNPLGVRNVTDITVALAAGGGTALAAGTDYNVDNATGRVQIMEGGAITAEADVLFGYKTVASKFESVKSGAKSELTGALRVVSDNAAGGNRDWYLPKVTLSPSGDLALIAEGTDVVVMEFELEALKPANGEAIYCDGRPVAV